MNSRLVAVLALLLFGTLSWASRADSLPDYSGRKVDSVRLIAPATWDRRELERFLEIRAGDPYSPRQIRRTIEVLSKLGEFSSIDVSATPQGESVSLVFRLVPVPRIRRIYFNGVHSSVARVRSAIAIQVGDAYPGDQDLVRMAEDVQAAYRHDGWREAKVEVKSTTNENLEVVLEVNVEEGPRLYIKEIVFRGDFAGAFEEKELLEASGLKTGKPMRDTAVLEARRKILALHRKLGYYEARIPEPLTPQDRDKGSNYGKVIFFVNSGEQINVSFRRRKIAWADQKTHPLFFWDFRDARLLQLLDLENENQFTEGYAEEASDRVSEYYRRKGYLEAKVTASLEVNNAKRKKIFRFDIDPGRRYRLLEVDVQGAEEGSKELRASTLREEFFSQSPSLRAGYYVPDDVEPAIAHLNNYLRSEGYAEARVDQRDAAIDRVKHTAKIFLMLEPGPRSRVGTVTFQGNAQVPSARLAGIIEEAPVRIRAGEPLNVVYLDRAEQAIEGYYASIGFPYASVKHAASPGEKKGIVNVDFQVDESFQAYVGRVIIKGNRYTKREVIDRAIPFKTGQSFNPQELQASQDALQKLGIFNQVTVVPYAEEEPERVRDILVGVSEANRIVVEPSIGASTEDGPRVGIRAQHRNLFGSAKSLTLRVQANWLWDGLPQSPESFQKPNAGFDEQRIEGRVLLTYTQPTTFGQPVTGSVTTSLFEKIQTRTWGYTGNRMIASADRTVKNDRFLPGFFKDASLTLAARYQFFLRDIQYLGRTAQEADVALTPQDRSFPSAEMFYWPLKWKIASGALAALVDKRDDRFNPRNGYSANLNGELASPFFGSDVAYAKATGGVTLFHPVPLDFLLVFAARGGYAKPIGQTTGIPIEQRFHLGGTGSVRGFREDSIGPRFALVNKDVSTGGDVGGLYNVELRHRLFPSLDWVVFHDAGWAKILYTRDLAGQPRVEPDPVNPGTLLRGPLVNPETISTSVGAGLRAHTPVGPVKFDLGIDTHKIERLDTLDGWQSDLLVHFTIGDF